MNVIILAFVEWFGLFCFEEDLLNVMRTAQITATFLT